MSLCGGAGPDGLWSAACAALAAFLLVPAPSVAGRAAPARARGRKRARSRRRVLGPAPAR